MAIVLWPTIGWQGMKLSILNVGVKCMKIYKESPKVLEFAIYDINDSVQIHFTGEARLIVCCNGKKKLKGELGRQINLEQLTAIWI